MYYNPIVTFVLIEYANRVGFSKILVDVHPFVGRNCDNFDIWNTRNSSHIAFSAFQCNVGSQSSRLLRNSAHSATMLLILFMEMKGKKRDGELP